MTASVRASGEARLRALRMVGFKSFAEKTVVEFGPGISAVVGPNGSGKSNLADALRWALGEQGRSLRSRKAEDLIFAGSASRSATGMADVTLTIGNEDRLLPIDFAEVDLGRRLYRSGENEYLLNRQRVRLRDVVELLDAANLADDAFLFIGQGMVDQALSLRPEERRSLFEEAAGVRRHERRRRQAETQLVEAESNLARVRDILAELRPQARRLAAQADQQVARRDAARELGQGLVAAARERWREATSATSVATEQLGSARAAADRALADLRAAEDEATTIARALSERAVLERQAREALETARARLTELRLADGRRRSDLEAAIRERKRIKEERGALDGRIAAARQAASEPIPDEDLAAADALAEAEREVARGEADLERLREADRSSDEREVAVRRAAASRAVALERLEADAARLTERLSEERRRIEDARTQSEEAAARLHAARAEREAAGAAEAEADAAAAGARLASEAAGGLVQARSAAARGLKERLGGLRGRLEALERDLEDEGRALIAAARRGGGRPIAEGLEVDPELRLAVEAALGAALVGVAVEAAALGKLRGHSGTALLPATRGPAQQPPEALLDAVLAAGGGRLVDGVRRDPEGHAGRLLSRTLWVPELDDALRLRDQLREGWRIATNQGEVVDADGRVELGARERRLERRASTERLTAEVADLEAEMARATDAEATARQQEAEATKDLERARRELGEARTRRRAADEAERVVARRDEAVGREHAWRQAQAERLESELSQAQEAAGEIDRASAAEASVGSGASSSDVAPSGAASGAGGHAAALEAEQRRLRERRDRLAESVRSAERKRREHEERQRRAEITLGIDEARLAQLDRDASALHGREGALEEALARLASELAAAAETESQAAAESASLLSADEGQRSRLAELEQATARARERLRTAEERSRLAERVELEQRLQLESVREALLVELAALGPAGLSALEGQGEEAARVHEDELAARLETALDHAAQGWAVGPGDPGAGEEADDGDHDAPSPTRLASLRRRYHELGASNPFAAEEFAEVRSRLETLEAQREDLEAAIAQTRELIEELTRLMTERFRNTFAALEAAFGRRFEQLFGGGEASLVLTEPEDLATTGIEIVARPPGKKRQALAMLSGGERALTAVALLFAMLEVRPVPFCVLDEVDAALDEANIDRFVGALRDLAQTIQFVVITHNRGTIENADALYGVTIGEDAVSRVISIRLSDAEMTIEGEGRAESRDRVETPA